MTGFIERNINLLHAYVYGRWTKEYVTCSETTSSLASGREENDGGPTGFT